MKIVIDENQRIQMSDDRGNDLFKLLADHGIYLKDIVLRLSPSGIGLSASLESRQYVIETPNELMNIVHALRSEE